MTSRFLLLLPILSMTPAAAQIFATPTPYCSGQLVAEMFNTEVTPGTQGRADYSMRLYNPGRAAVRFRVQVVGDMLGRPSGQQSVGGGQRLTVGLGYSNNYPGRPPMRGETLVNATRISCL